MTTPKKEKPPNYGVVIQEILEEARGPIDVETMAAEILERRPSKAKNPRQAALAKIHEEAGRLLIFLDSSTVIPIEQAYNGARYRIRLDRETVQQAALPLELNFGAYLPGFKRPKGFLFLDANDELIPFQIASTTRKVSFFGDSSEYEEDEVVLKEWFREQKIKSEDHILVTVINSAQGIFQLGVERPADRQPEKIQERNQQIADFLFDLLERSQYEDIWTNSGVPTAYAQLPDKAGYPGDHWLVIIEADPRMKVYGPIIRYAESRSLLDSFLEEFAGELVSSPPSPVPQISKEQGNQVYRFRAAFAHNPKIWREIEIKGKQTLADLDLALRHAFEHDTYDHLGGFWKRIPRGGGRRKRYREVSLGDVDPEGGGTGAEMLIAELGLKVGDQMKYVFDFGDWVEHTLELAAIGEPEKKAKYPREAARNKPKYKYCVECKEEGKQTVAKWTCLTCSMVQQKEVVLCTRHAEQHEEDEEYVIEIIY